MKVEGKLRVLHVIILEEDNYELKGSFNFFLSVELVERAAKDPQTLKLIQPWLMSYN